MTTRTNKLQKHGRKMLTSPMFWFATFVATSVSSLAVFPALREIDPSTYTISRTLSSGLSLTRYGAFDAAGDRILLGNNYNIKAYDASTLALQYTIDETPSSQTISPEALTVSAAQNVGLYFSSSQLYMFNLSTGAGITSKIPDVSGYFFSSPSCSDIKTIGNFAYALLRDINAEKSVLVKFNITGNTITQLGSVLLRRDEFNGSIPGKLALNSDGSLIVANTIGKLSDPTNGSYYEPTVYAVNTSNMNIINSVTLEQTVDNPRYFGYAYASGGIAISDSSVYATNFAKGEVVKLTLDATNGVGLTSTTFDGLDGPYDVHTYNDRVHVANFGSILVNGEYVGENADIAGIGDSLTVINPATDTVETTVTGLSSPDLVFSGDNALYVIQGPVARARIYGTYGVSSQIVEITNTAFKGNQGMFGRNNRM